MSFDKQFHKKDTGKKANAASAPSSPFLALDQEFVASLVSGGWRTVNTRTKADVLLPVTQDQLVFLGFAEVEPSEAANLLGLPVDALGTAFKRGEVTDPNEAYAAMTKEKEDADMDKSSLMFPDSKPDERFKREVVSSGVADAGTPYHLETANEEKGDDAD